MNKVNDISKELLKVISGPDEDFKGAYNIRQNCQSAGCKSSPNIEIVLKEDGSGMDVKIKPNTKDEVVYAPALVTEGGVYDLVYNNFYVGENAEVTIVAGCGIHSDTGGKSKHDGIHHFYLGKNSRVKYMETHIGTGAGGKKDINPVTEAVLEEGAHMEMLTTQISGVNNSLRKTRATVAAGGNLIIKESLMTDERESCITDFEVDLNGEGSGTHLVSRSVAKGNSEQSFTMKINGNAECHGHAECDAIIMDQGVVTALPGLVANHIDAQLIHEAAIGKIAGDQLIKLMTLGLTEEEAEEQIIKGFLS